jgi:hypothetical protein
VYAHGVITLLAPVAAPSAGSWTTAISLASLKLSQATAILIALEGAGPNDQVAVYFSLNSGLDPSTTGTDELFTPTQVQVVDGMALLAGPNTTAIQFSFTDPPYGTYLYFFRAAGTSSIEIQISGEANPVSGTGQAWVQGGNTGFGHPGILGTLDANTLDVITNNVPAILIDDLQDVIIGSGLTDATTFVRSGPTGQAFFVGGTLAEIRALSRGTIEIGADSNEQFIVVGGGSPSTTISLLNPVFVGPALVPINASAALDLSTFTTLGIGPPQVPDATLLAITNPLAGLFAFGSTTNIARMNVGTPSVPNWRKVAGGPLVRATNTSGQSIPSGTSTTVTGWTAITNVGACFVPSTGIVTPSVEGFYTSSFGVQFSTNVTSLGNNYQVSLVLTGGTFLESRFITAQVAGISGSFTPSLSVAGIELSAGQTFSPQAFQNSGAGLTLAQSTLTNTFSFALLS